MIVPSVHTLLEVFVNDKYIMFNNVVPHDFMWGSEGVYYFSMWLKRLILRHGSLPSTPPVKAFVGYIYLGVFQSKSVAMEFHVLGVICNKHTYVIDCCIVCIVCMYLSILMYSLKRIS